MEEDGKVGDIDNPLGRVTFCSIRATSFYFDNLQFSKETLKEKALKCSLTFSSGSRILAWRFMLNLIPLE